MKLCHVQDPGRWEDILEKQRSSQKPSQHTHMPHTHMHTRHHIHTCHMLTCVLTLTPHTYHTHTHLPHTHIIHTVCSHTPRTHTLTWQVAVLSQNKVRLQLLHLWETESTEYLCCRHKKKTLQSTKDYLSLNVLLLREAGFQRCKQRGESCLSLRAHELAESNGREKVRNRHAFAMPKRF